MTFGTGYRERESARSVDWLPTKETVAVWNLASAPMGLAAAAVFGLVACRGQIPSGFDIKWQEMLAMAAATLAVFVLHELVHGGVMEAFDAEVRFGLTGGGTSLLGSTFYARAPKHLFSRGQYVAIALAPAALISLAGIAVCLTPLAVVVWLPLTFHFMSCVGDIAVALRTLREPASTRCEDLPDGVRFVYAEPRMEL